MCWKPLSICFETPFSTVTQSRLHSLLEVDRVAGRASHDELPVHKQTSGGPVAGLVHDW